MGTNELVRIDNLRAGYGRMDALHDIQTALPAGEIIGLAGANGSGKTTLMRVLAGMLPRYKGTVSINGCIDTWKAKAEVCFLPTDPFFVKNHTVTQEIDLYARLFPAYRREMAVGLCGRFSLPLAERLSSLSKGRQALALFILHLAREARLYLLDEPFRGIDMKTRQQMKEVLIEAVTPEKTFLVSTHEMLEMESLFDRVLLIREGSLVFNEEADTLRENTGSTLAELVREAM